MTPKLVMQIIEKYSGWRPKDVKKMEVVPDPQVEGTFAIRTIMKKGKPMDWMLVRYHDGLSIEEAEKCVEECEYDSWPPVSGNLQFFM